MAAVSWCYPHEELVTRRADARPRTGRSRNTIERHLQIDSLNFRYGIEGDDPHWCPLRTFDKGWKVFIQFPTWLDPGETPPLFVVGRNGESQLVNYRTSGTYYIVDRLFTAELRLGENNQNSVRNIRTRAALTQVADLGRDSR